MGVLGLADLGQTLAGQQRIRRDPLVQLLQRGAAQHFVGDDGIEDRLALSRMEIRPAPCRAVPCRARIRAEPPGEQLGGGRRDQREDLRHALFQTDAQRIGTGAQGVGQSQSLAAVVVESAHRPPSTPTSTLTSASKPNTSTARTQTRRGPGLAGTLNTASVVTRSGSPSPSRLPR